MKKLLAVLTTLTAVLAVVTIGSTSAAHATYSRGVTDARGDFVKGEAYAKAPTSLKDNADILRVTYQRSSSKVFTVAVQLRSVDGRGKRNYQQLAVHGFVGRVGVHLFATRTAEGDVSSMTWTGKKTRHNVCAPRLRSSFDVRHDVVRISVPVSCFPGGTFVKKLFTTAYVGDTTQHQGGFPIGGVAQDETGRIPFRLR